MASSLTLSILRASSYEYRNCWPNCSWDSARSERRAALTCAQRRGRGFPEIAAPAVIAQRYLPRGVDVHQCGAAQRGGAHRQPHRYLRLNFTAPVAVFAVS